AFHTVLQLRPLLPVARLAADGAVSAPGRHGPDGGRPPAGAPRLRRTAYRPLRDDPGGPPDGRLPLLRRGQVAPQRNPRADRPRLRRVLRHARRLQLVLAGEAVLLPAAG